MGGNIDENKKIDFMFIVGNGNHRIVCGVHTVAA